MIDLLDARRHLRIDGSEDDEEIAQKLAEAIGLACLYVGKPADEMPYDLRTFEGVENEQIIAAYAAEKAAYQNRGFDAAVLLILGDLWRNRESGTADPLSPAVKNILNLYRMPSYA